MSQSEKETGDCLASGTRYQWVSWQMHLDPIFLNDDRHDDVIEITGKLVDSLAQLIASWDDVFHVITKDFSFFIVLV